MLHPSDAPAFDREGRVDAVRARLILAIVLEFVALMGLATILGSWEGGAAGDGRSVLLLLIVAALLPIPISVLARQAIRLIEGLDAERRTLLDLYNRARNDALSDALTGLGNHRAFQEELARQLEYARRAGTALSLLLIDVDDLKKINDDRGHARGDEVLAAVGRVAMAVLRRNDRAFRIGGDEFAILLPLADIEIGLAVARRILASALGGGDPGRPVDPFSVSVGVSSFPSPASEGRHLYRQADAALYWCKRHGRTAVTAYDPGRHGAQQDGRSIEEMSAGIGEVLTSRLLRPVYQPIFSLVTGLPIGYEGLVRPEPGAPFDNAAALFAAAEAADRTVELDLACIDIVAAGAGPLEPRAYLGINVSPRTLGSEVFHPTEIIAILNRHGIVPNQVLIELTEREPVEDLAQLRRNVAACRQAGFRLAADDVGAGNAGLRLLSEIQFDTLKIDLSLVQGGVLHDPSHAVLRALQELASRSGASVVAEGVETPEQLRVIRSLGMGAGQGYLLGRPAKQRSRAGVDLDALASPAVDDLLPFARVG